MTEDAPVGVAVVGGGLVAQIVHLPLLSALRDEFTLVGVAEPSPKVRATLAERYRPPRTCGDWRELLEEDALEALIITSPNPTHAEIAQAALERGLHILVEKPMCLTASQAQDIIAQRDRAGLVVQVGYMKRYDATYRALLGHIGQATGQLRYIDAVTYDPGLPGLLPPGTITGPDDLPAEDGRTLERTSVSQGREATGLTGPDAAAVYSNIYMGALIHDVNAIAGILQAAGDRLPETATGSRYWANGRAASMTCSTIGGVSCATTWLELPGVGVFTETVRVHSTREVYELVFGAPYAPIGRTRTTLTRADRGGERQSLASSVTADAYEHELRHFHSAIRHQTQTLTPAEQALADQRLLADAFRHALEPLPAPAQLSDIGGCAA
jgi:predicted dehydrogenase